MGIEDLKDNFSEASENLKDKADQATQKAEEAMEDAKDSWDEKGGEVEKSSKDWVEDQKPKKL